MTSAMILATLGALILSFFAPMVAPTSGGGGDYSFTGMGNALIGWAIGLISIIIFMMVGVWWALLIFPPLLAFAIPAIFIRS